MKVSRARTVPLDILAFDHGEYHVYVGTHRNEVHVRIEKDGTPVHSQAFTADQFISLLMRDAK